MMEIDHKNTDDIICPYCGCEHSDSWEYNNDNELDCEECEKRFNLYVNHTVDYTTSKIMCKEGEHNYLFFKPLLQYSKMLWLKEAGKYAENNRILPEEEWQFIEIMKCSKCDDETFNTILPREEWIKKYPKDWESYQDWIKRDKEILERINQEEARKAHLITMEKQI